MTRFLLLMFVSAIGLHVFADDFRPDRDGADTSVGVVVVDQDGYCVDNADVAFKIFTTFDKYDVHRGRTDAKGRCSTEGMTRGEVDVRVEKAGYYPSVIKASYRNMDWERSVAERKWADAVVWNRIVLKKILNPQPMMSKSLWFAKPPQMDIPVGFDAEVCDWCEPHGKGMHNDLMITMFSDGAPDGVGVRGMCIQATNCVDGLYQRETDATSRLKYDYRADTNATYQTGLAMGATVIGGRTNVVSRNERGTYWVFRLRTKTNDVGRVVHARYGIIRERLNFSGGLSIGIQMNGRDNDVNLEDVQVVRTMRSPKCAR